MATTTTPIHILALFLLLLLLAGTSGSHGQMNVIDRCWRHNPYWPASRQQLAVCAVGFSGKMMGNQGPDLTQYTVIDPSDDPTDPRPGTLRYGATAIQGKVWITFERDMHIKLEQPLLVKSFTTIDGRGADVHIASGAGFLLHEVSDVIIHGLQFHDIQATTNGGVLMDGDAIRILTSSKIWIDHNTLSSSQDGLIDVTRGSTDVTISNNWFRDHDKVMLLGHDDGYVEDRMMRVTIVFNRFGPNCNQRMPRARYGYVHVANNLYEGWKEYAIGGSMSPRIKSEANKFVASENGNKAVTWVGDETKVAAWQSVNDVFINGAFFGATDQGMTELRYNIQQNFPVERADAIMELTWDAGALRCSKSGC